MNRRACLLATARQSDVAGFLEHLKRHGVESRSSARKLSCLRGFYRWMLLDKRIAHDPTLNLESPSTWKVLPKSMAESEITTMLDHAALAATHPQRDGVALRDNAILELLYAAGVRVSELTDLRVEDLSLDEQRVLVRGKGDKERVVPIGTSAVHALAAYVEHGRPELDAWSSQARRQPSLPLRARQGTHAAVDLEAGEVGGFARQPAHAATQLRHPYGGAWR